MRLLVAAVVAAAFMPAMAQEPDYAKFVRSAKNNLTRDFRDPASAQFRDLFVAKSGDLLILCGEVNAKNAYGAYIGFRKFFASDMPDVHAIRGTGADSIVYDRLSHRCATKVMDVE
jgi:hypothetical protein